MKVAIIPNISKKDVPFYTEKIIKTLMEFNVSILMERQYEMAFKDTGCCFYSEIEDVFNLCDVVLAVGGDGTLIHTAKFASKAKKPILGVNLGRLGFVSGLEVNELYKLGKIVNGNYETQNRMLLCIEVLKKTGKEAFYALNDAVISRGELSRILDVDIMLEETNVCAFRSDGVILATPTGSTAYSLSAGGPIVDPRMGCILMTPLCSHSMFSRPQIFSEDSKLIINARSRENAGVFLTIDGEDVIDISDGTLISVSKASLPVKLINLEDKSFYQKISEKLSERRVGLM
ncbi:MAG: NAD kinase [Eubacteriales bacterium SKADARSKE-1]|nr:NAD kinase [Eubacteriales bacterium SKADARSKE-1]